MTSTLNYAQPLTFPNGAQLKHRIGLAALTNLQSPEKGKISEEEMRWMRMRAEGGCSMIITAATYITPSGQGFPGQIGISSDEQLPGLTAAADMMRANNAMGIVQLIHGGIRCPEAITGMQPVGPSDDSETGARALTLAEIDTIKSQFLDGAKRAQKAGFDGVEVHGAHNYLLAQFLSPIHNQRTDQYGGSIEKRAQLLLEITAEIRDACGPDFVVGVRLSPEHHGVILDETVAVYKMIIEQGVADFIDISMWDVFKEPADEKFQGKSLLSYFTDVDRGNIKLGVAGKLYNAQDIAKSIELGADFVLLGRGAIFNHDFASQALENPDFQMVERPVSREYLEKEGLSAPFINYIASAWPEYLTNP